MDLLPIQIFDDPTPKLTKKQKKQLRQQNGVQNTGLKIKEITPLTNNQNRTFTAYDSNKHLLLTGCPGTGKSFLTLYLALDEILEGQTPYKKLIILRSAVEGRKIGFLPGKACDKMAVYKAPYKKIASDLFGRADAYDILEQKKIIEFESTSFLRGLTYSDCVLLVDEFQNMNWMELKTIITRLGDNTKIIFAGDVKQSDLEKDKYDCNKFINVLKEMKEFIPIDFEAQDIVRSSLVKSFILTSQSLGYDF